MEPKTMKAIGHILCLCVGILIGAALGFVGVDVFTSFIQVISEPDIQLSSKTIKKRMHMNGLSIPEKSYDLEYFSQSSWTDSTKMIAFSSSGADILNTVEMFIRVHPPVRVYKTENKEQIPWPRGPDWWPKNFELATVYIGEYYSLVHDRKHHRLYIRFFYS